MQGVLFCCVLSVLACYVASEISTNFEPQIVVATQINLTPTCNCTVGKSRYCSTDGYCSSAKVGRALKQSVQEIRRIIEILGNFPGDRPRSVLKEHLCRKMVNRGEIIDLVFMDFDEDYEPACGRLVSDSREEEDIHICSLAPPKTAGGRMENNELRMKIKNLYSFLGCSEKLQPKLPSRHFHFCRDTDYCNGFETLEAEALEALVESPMTLSQGQSGAGISSDPLTARFSVMQIVLYFVVPIVVCLILVIVILGLIYAKPGAWRYVFPVAKVQASTLPVTAVKH